MSGAPPAGAPAIPPQQLKDMAALAMYCPACAMHFRSKSAHLADDEDLTFPVTLVPCGHMICRCCEEELDKCDPPKKCLVCQKEVTGRVENLQYGDFAELKYKRARLDAAIAAIPTVPAPECTDCMAMGQTNDMGFWSCTCDASKRLCGVHADTHQKLGHAVTVGRVVRSPLFCPHSADPLCKFCSQCSSATCDRCLSDPTKNQCKDHPLEKMTLTKRIPAPEDSMDIHGFFVIG